MKTLHETDNPGPYFVGNFSNLQLAKKNFIQVFMYQKTENFDFGHEGFFGKFMVRVKVVGL